LINYAHRGASEYAPENTLSSFYLGLLQGANGIETDVQRTKDGVLVLFHDSTLDRVTDSDGEIENYTYSELRRVKVYGKCESGFYDRIPTLREFLEKFHSYDISLAIELKGAGVEDETLLMVKEFGIMDKVTFTSFNFEYIERIKALDPAARVGWLCSEVTPEMLEELLRIGGEEIAPKAAIVTPELMKEWQRLGLGVRAWGVSSVELMKKMCELGVDGMTVNFPDKLTEYLKN
jgi:glycerophosphoryl diester phosphodiesterase